MLKSFTKIALFPFKHIREFIRLETASGIILFLMALAALAICNSPWNALYQKTFNQILFFHQPLSFWINEGLMTLFFVLVGLEIKRELIIGALDTMQKRLLPGIAALGGMIIPAIIFATINWHDPITLKGWAIPSATDIAFALGVLLLLGSRIPVSLKIFLMALAILDDLGAVIIISLFYSKKISLIFLALAGLCCLLLFLLNKKGIVNLWVYNFIGILLWLCTLHSGVHPTIAGVIFAFSIPLRTTTYSPLRLLEHYLHPWIAYIVMPLFAFANAGLNFSQISLQDIFAPLPLGIILGLSIGKQLGVFGASYIAIKLRIAQLPQYVTWRHLYGVAVICGIGFTMSLFIGNLAFEDLSAKYLDCLRLGVLAGSILSGLLGYCVLCSAARRHSSNHNLNDTKVSVKD